MTCKDCVKYDACLAYNGGMTRTTSMKNKADEMCGHFKNKADFVEVVRCSRCQHGKEYAHSMRFKCRRFDRDTVENGFCNYGKRKR